MSAFEISQEEIDAGEEWARRMRWIRLERRARAVAGGAFGLVPCLAAALFVVLR